MNDTDVWKLFHVVEMCVLPTLERIHCGLPKHELGPNQVFNNFIAKYVSIDNVTSKVIIVALQAHEHWSIPKRSEH